jgi:hypothetical protein
VRREDCGTFGISQRFMYRVDWFRLWFAGFLADARNP